MLHVINYYVHEIQELRRMLGPPKLQTYKVRNVNMIIIIRRSWWFTSYVNLLSVLCSAFNFLAYFPLTIKPYILASFRRNIVQRSLTS